MHIGNTSVHAFAFRTRFGGSAIVVRVGLAVAIASAPVTGALAQGMQASSRNSIQQRPTAAQGRPSPRLVVPVTGTLGTGSAVPNPAALEDAATTTAVATPPLLEQAAVPTVTGSFSIQRFAPTTGGGVAAVGTLTLSVVEQVSAAARTIITPATMPVTAGSNAGTPDGQTQAPPALAQACETLRLVLGRVDVDLPGLPVQLDEVNVDVVQGVDQRVGAAVCQAGGLIDQAATPADVARALNTLLVTIE